MEETQRIRLLIGDASYPLRVNREDEQLYRNAALQVNAMLNRYRETFPGLSKEQYLAMVALHNAYMCLENRNDNDTAPFAARLQQSIDLLTDYLSPDASKNP